MRQLAMKSAAMGPHLLLVVVSTYTLNSIEFTYFFSISCSRDEIYIINISCTHLIFYV